MSSAPLPVVVTADPVGLHSPDSLASAELVITIPFADPAPAERQKPWLCWRDLLGER